MDKTTPMKSKPLVNVTCKLGAKGCFEDGRCHALGRCENKIETNADRIRTMSDEELVELFMKLAWNGEVQTTPLRYLDWLKSEVKGSDV